MSNDQANGREAAWQALAAHATTLEATDLRQLFAADPDRFERLSAEAAGVFVDYSRNRLTEATLDRLAALAEACGLGPAIDALFSGQPVNNTERRAALHPLLRAPEGPPLTLDGHDARAAVRRELQRMGALVTRLRAGRWQGATGRAVTDVVCLGIGGSHLGPLLGCEALAWGRGDTPRLHFVANIDPHAITATLAALEPARTLFVVASKSWTTLETRHNATRARGWLSAALGEVPELARHFIAITARPQAAHAEGYPEDQVLAFWDWVGGRYSLWSTIGLPIALAIGMEGFEQLLAGARAMDEHFRTAPLTRNLPVVLGLVGVWYRDILGAPSCACIPYDERLRRLPEYLQQLDMESNGKGVTRDGQPITHGTGPILWGGVGTNAQHAFFQLLHQGNHLVPLDFVAVAGDDAGDPEGHALLLANCIAQGRALMWGRTAEEARAAMAAAGLPAAECERLAPHRSFPGNRPSNTLLLDRLTPATLGALLALYEHKVFVQAVVWQINPFDQWGVELGKEMAGQLAGPGPSTAALDASTRGLLSRVGFGD